MEVRLCMSTIMMLLTVPSLDMSDWRERWPLGFDVYGDIKPKNNWRDFMEGFELGFIVFLVLLCGFLICAAVALAVFRVVVPKIIVEHPEDTRISGKCPMRKRRLEYRRNAASAKRRK